MTIMAMAMTITTARPPRRCDDHGHGGTPSRTNPVGGDPAADPAGHPVDRHRFLQHRPMLFGTDWAGHHAHEAIKGQAQTFFTGIVDFYDPAKNTTLPGRRVPRPVAFAARHDAAAVLADRGGLPAGCAVLPVEAGPVGQGAQDLRPAGVGAGKQVRLDKLWIDGFAGGSVKLGKVSRWIDSNIVDGVVNLSARVVDVAAGVLRRTQSGFSITTPSR
jgi:NADH-quinone oxidoreductase subunit L